MNCTICGQASPPDTTTCPSCGAVLPSLDVVPSLDTVPSPYQADVDLIPQVSPVPPAKVVSTPTDLQLLHTQQKPQGRGFSVKVKLLFSILALLIIAEGGGGAYYGIVLRPAEFLAHATAVAGIVLTARAQAMSPQEIYILATSRKPVIDDPLSSQKNNLWYVSDVKGGCVFTDGSYHVRVSGFANIVKCNCAKSFSNFAFQVQMKIFSGDIGGLIFRAYSSFAGPNYYFFGITYNGFYIFGLAPEEDGQVLNTAPSSAIKQGKLQQNLLTVVAMNANMYLYINKQFVAMVSDSTYSSGNIGLAATTTFTDPKAGLNADVAFNNALVWNL
jgi:hypothetical protein